MRLHALILILATLTPGVLAEPAHGEQTAEQRRAILESLQWIHRQAEEGRVLERDISDPLFLMHAIAENAEDGALRSAARHHGREIARLARDFAPLANPGMSTVDLLYQAGAHWLLGEFGHPAHRARLTGARILSARSVRAGVRALQASRSPLESTPLRAMALYYGDKAGRAMDYGLWELAHELRSEIELGSPPFRSVDDLAEYNFLSHFLLALDDFHRFSLSRQLFPEAHRRVLRGLEQAKSAGDIELACGWTMTLAAFDSEPARSAVASSRRDVLAAQNADGSWGAEVEDDNYQRYHATWLCTAALVRFERESFAPLEQACISEPVAAESADGAPEVVGRQLGRTIVPELVSLPGGTFSMGKARGATAKGTPTADDSPVHPVTLSDFAIGRHEVTNAQFVEFVAGTGYRTDAERSGGCIGVGSDGRWGWQEGLSWRSFAGEGRENHPVVCVSWNDAAAYSMWLSQVSCRSYRLPTEAEWEFAAKAGRTGGDAGLSGVNGARYWLGEPVSLSEDDAASREILEVALEHSGILTLDVDSLPADGNGIHGLLGNVVEWTADRYDPTYYARSPEIDPKGPSAGARAVLRGGGWTNADELLTPTARGRGLPRDSSVASGFRVVRPGG